MSPYRGGVSDVGIRPETEQDVDAVLDVLETVAAEGRWIGAEAPLERGPRAERIRDGLQHPDTFAAFVAEVDGVVVGSIGLQLAPYGVANLGMAILDGFRGRGIGTRLLEVGIAWARRAGAHKVALEVWPHNDRAIGLYRKMGFVEEGRLRRHYRRRNGELWDAVVMGLVLEPDHGPVATPA